MLPLNNTSDHIQMLFLKIVSNRGARFFSLASYARKTNSFYCFVKHSHRSEIPDPKIAPYLAVRIENPKEKREKPPTISRACELIVGFDDRVNEGGYF